MRPGVAGPAMPAGSLRALRPSAKLRGPLRALPARHPARSPSDGRRSPVAAPGPPRTVCRSRYERLRDSGIRTDIYALDSNVTIQFGAKPLFEQVTVKFSDGNRYGLIGANGSGKSTLMKILGGELEHSTGDVMLQTGVRLGKLNQNQFAYEDERVLDVVMQGHAEMWQAMRERDRIYANAERQMTITCEPRSSRGSSREYGGYDAEARAGSILTEAGIPESLHNGPMREVAPGLKLRVLLAQALFSKPDVLLLDEPTNNSDIHSIRWLEGVINDYDATMIIISHDRYFLNQVCTHIADLDFQQLKVYPGNYDDFMLASQPGASAGGSFQCQGQGPNLGPAGICAPLLGQRLKGAPGDLTPQAAREDQTRRHQALLPSEPLHPLRAAKKLIAPRSPSRSSLSAIRAPTPKC